MNASQEVLVAADDRVVRESFDRVGMSIAAPFIGLVGVVRKSFDRVGMSIVAPFIGLVCVVFFRFVVLAMAWMDGRAVLGADAKLNADGRLAPRRTNEAEAVGGKSTED